MKRPPSPNFWPTWSVVLLLLGLLGTAATAAPLIKEEGAIYLEEALPENKIELKVLQEAAVYTDSKATRQIGILVPGLNVRLLAVGKNLYRINGRATHGPVLGWVQPDYLEPVDPELLANLGKMEERRKQVQSLIEQREIATGFTQAEVQQSLGKPQKRSSRVNSDSTADIWEYIKYRYVPQQVQSLDQFGRLVWTTVQVKVPAGRRIVTFSNGVVVEISEDEESTVNPGVKIVPGPYIPYRGY